MKNPAFATFQKTRAAISAAMGRSYGNESLESLDYALVNAPRTSALRILHPLFFKEWREPKRKTATHAVQCVGLDVETLASTGEPRMLGYWFEDGTYYCDDAPSLARFMRTTRNLRDKSESNYCVWGRLDIQVILRLFEPNKTERLNISSGLSGKTHDGVITVPFPLTRTLRDGTQCFIAHYIPGRSLRIGWLDGRYERSMWIYNISQYYPARIADTARGMGLDWQEFDKTTHIIDWEKYAVDEQYKEICRQSNQQDARIVATLAQRIQSDFFDVIGAYPTQLVSTGSLTDAAVSAMLNDDDYKATSWVWLRRNGLGSPEMVAKLDSLLAESFSAGYVDQYAIGYFETVSTADISAAYPHKIRSLPDLRHAVLISGSGPLGPALERAKADGLIIESAIIRGRVTIPPTLTYHPITLRNFKRQNYRCIGTFNAAYTLDERDWCTQYGATFEHEEWIIIALKERVQSPIGRVSESLGKMRADLIAQRETVKKARYTALIASGMSETDAKENAIDSDEWRVLEARQYIVKVVDNSLYGKTTMTTEVVETVDGAPSIVGYKAGDRFNALYATLITARTRTQLADACMRIAERGGKPIMNMTDSVYWEGSPDCLPSDLWRNGKVAGYFEKPETVNHLYILKTGQYEYQKGTHIVKETGKSEPTYHHKLRGIPVQFENVKTNAPFYRGLLQQVLSDPAHQWTANIDIVVTIPTRKLATIGQPDLEKLGAVIDDTMDLRPFSLSTKTTRFDFDWRDCVNYHVWLPATLAPQTDSVPFGMLAQMYESGIGAHFEHFRTRKVRNQTDMRKRKTAYVIERALTTERGLPPDIPRMGDAPWTALTSYYDGERGKHQ